MCSVRTDEKLARCLQDFEHENHAERSLRDSSMREIMDETYALSLAQNDSVPFHYTKWRFCLFVIEILTTIMYA